MNSKFSKPQENKRNIFLISAIIGVSISLLFIFIFSLIMLFGEIDRAFAAPFSTFSVAAGTFFSAMYTAHKIGDKGYLWGIVTGSITFFIILIISLIVDNSGLSMNTLFHFIIILLSSLTGGIIGVNKGKNKKYI